MLRKIGFIMIVLGLAALPGCGAGLVHRPAGELSDAAMEEALERATRSRDRARALELVNVVLEDSLRRTQRYGYYSRRSAFHAISELELSESAGLLRQVAGMSYEPAEHGSRQDLPEIIAITGALDNLTHLGDPEAPRLNRLQMNVPSNAALIRSRAIANLATLEEWEATGDVRRILRETEPAPEAILYLTAAVRFLGSSPMATEEDCSILPRLKSGYRQCFDPDVKVPGISGCQELRQATETLASRLRC